MVGKCSGFNLVDDFASSKIQPSGSLIKTSVLTKVLENSKAASKMTSMFSELIALVVFSTGCLNSPVKSKNFISFLNS